MYQQQSSSMESASSCDSLLTNIPTRNARGVALLQFGDLESAILVFRSTLEEVRQHVGVPSADCGYADFAQDRLQIIPTQEVPFGGNKLQEEGALFCRQPFLVLSMEEQQQERFDLTHASQRDLNLLVATLLFNLALANHLYAQTQRANWTSLVHKTLFLYNHAIRVSSFLQGYLQSDPQPGDNNCSRMSELSVAIGNNLAVLLAEIHDLSALQECLEWTSLRANTPSVASTYFWTNMLSWHTIRAQPSAAA